VLSPSLRQSLQEAVRAIAPGKQGQAGIAVTLDGVAVEVGYKPKPWVDLSAYAGRTWGREWTAGARAGVSW